MLKQRSILSTTMSNIVTDVCDRVVAACGENKYVLSNLKNYGLTKEDMRILYEAVSDDTGELSSERGYPICILCTAWLHAARLLVKRGSASCSVKEEATCILRMADNVMRELGLRSAHPKNGSIARALRGCLDLGKSVGVVLDGTNMDDVIHHFMCYGEIQLLSL